MTLRKFHSRKLAKDRSLLLGNAHGVSAVTTSGLGVLTAHTDVPVVTETTVQADTLHPFDVLAKLLAQEICVLLADLAILDVTAAVEHPGWDLELQGVADHGHDLVDLVCAH